MGGACGLGAGLTQRGRQGAKDRSVQVEPQHLTTWKRFLLCDGKPPTKAAQQKILHRERMQHA